MLKRYFTTSNTLGNKQNCTFPVIRFLINVIPGSNREYAQILNAVVEPALKHISFISFFCTEIALCKCRLVQNSAIEFAWLAKHFVLRQLEYTPKNTHDSGATVFHPDFLGKLPSVLTVSLSRMSQQYIVILVRMSLVFLMVA